MQATHPEGARFGVRTPLSLGPEAGAALQVNLHVQPTFDLEDRGCKSTALGPVTSGTLQRSLDNGDQRPFTLFAIGLDSVGQPCAGPMASRAIGCLIADDDALFSPTLLVLRDGPSP